MDRDEFEKLAKCAKDDSVCSREIFKTNETNPYVITANLAGILTTEHRMEPDRIKLLYDIVCDQSMLSVYSFPYFICANNYSQY